MRHHTIAWLNQYYIIEQTSLYLSKKVIALSYHSWFCTWQLLSEIVPVVNATLVVHFADLALRKPWICVFSCCDGKYCSDTWLSWGLREHSTNAGVYASDGDYQTKRLIRAERACSLKWVGQRYAIRRDEISQTSSSRRAISLPVGARGIHQGAVRWKTAGDITAAQWTRVTKYAGDVSWQSQSRYVKRAATVNTQESSDPSERSSRPQVTFAIAVWGDLLLQNAIQQREVLFSLLEIDGASAESWSQRSINISHSPMHCIDCNSFECLRFSLQGWATKQTNHKMTSTSDWFSRFFRLSTVQASHGDADRFITEPTPAWTSTKPRQVLRRGKATVTGNRSLKLVPSRARVCKTRWSTSGRCRGTLRYKLLYAPGKWNLTSVPCLERDLGRQLHKR